MRCYQDQYSGGRILNHGGGRMKDLETLFIVDNDVESARALDRLLRSQGYEPRVFQSALDFLRTHEPSSPGCLILDHALPLLDGLETQSVLRAAGCRRPVIFLSGTGTIQTAADAMRAGAVDFLTKPVREADLFRAVEEALRMDRLNRGAIQDAEAILRRFATLTAREREVLEHVVRGRLNKQIAGDLGTVEKTIKVHRARLMQKMQARSVAALVHLANSIGIGAHRVGVTEVLGDAVSKNGYVPTCRIATWDWDVENDRVIADPNLAMLFGVADGATRDYPLTRYLKAIDPEDSPRVTFLIREALMSGKRYKASYRIAQGKLEPTVVMAQGRAEYDAAGKPVRLVGVLVDVTHTRTTVSRSPQRDLAI
jgi:FixJ family two-component response regulator